jgi:hypothetical protein
MIPKKSPFSVILRVGGESRKSLKTLDPPVKPGDDDIITLITFRKDLFMIPISIIKNFIIKHSSPLRNGVFC